MPTRETGTAYVQDHAEVLGQKYGAYGLVYAETRREAAETIGDQEKAKHWRKVAVAIRGNAGR